MKKKTKVFYRKRVVESIRTVFQSRDDINDEIHTSSRKLIAAFKKVNLF